jgi:hypothetical protein
MRAQFYETHLGENLIHAKKIGGLSVENGPSRHLDAQFFLLAYTSEMRFFGRREQRSGNKKRVGRRIETLQSGQQIPISLKRKMHKKSGYKLFNVNAHIQ